MPRIGDFSAASLQLSLQEQLRRRTSSWVRLRAPPGIGSVQTFSGRHINVGLDGAIEMSVEDAQYYIRDGWTKLAEWTTEHAV